MNRKKETKQHQAGKKNPPAPIQAVDIERWKYFTALFIILILSFIAYLPVLKNGFVWDDKFYIVDNPLIQSINLKEIFSRNVMGNYHPLTILMLAIEYHFFGLNETGYHTVNLLLHLLNVVLVFYVVLLISDKTGVALVASLLFGIHPLHVESVAWAAELKDLLYTFFFLAAYIFYLKFLKDKQKKFYVLALILFPVSLLSKGMAASLPVLLLLTDYFRGRKINGKIILEKIPFFLLAVVLGAVAIWAQSSNDSIQEIAVFTFPQRLVFACFGFMSYLFKLLLPLNLCAYYPYPMKSGGNIPFEYYTYVIYFLALAGIIFYSLRKTKKIFFGLGFFAVTVFLVLQLLPVGEAIMADRYSYIPSIGIFYLAGEGFNLLWSKKLKWIAIVLLSGFTIFFSFTTYARCGIWKNKMTLWNNVISQYQTIPDAYNNRGVVYMNEKRNEEAIDDFNKAIKLDPGFVQPFFNRGIVFMNENKNNQALDDFNKVIELKSNYINAYYLRGNILRDNNKYQEALKDYYKVIELNPDYVEAYFAMGTLFTYEKKYEPAFENYSKAIALNTNYTEAYVNRGNILRDENKIEAALKDYQKAIELKPDFPIIYFSRGTLFMNQKNYDDAIRDFSKAVELNADYAKAYYHRGLAEFNSGKKEAACTDMKRAASLGFQQASDILLQFCK